MSWLWNSDRDVPLNNLDSPGAIYYYLDQLKQAKISNNETKQSIVKKLKLADSTRSLGQRASLSRPNMLEGIVIELDLIYSLIGKEKRSENAAMLHRLYDQILLFMGEREHGYFRSKHNQKRISLSLQDKFNKYDEVKSKSIHTFQDPVIWLLHHYKG